LVFERDLCFDAFFFFFGALGVAGGSSSGPSSSVERYTTVSMVRLM
jgi:hypothetical protein